MVQEAEVAISESIFVSSEPRRRNSTTPDSTRRTRASTYQGETMLPADRNAAYMRRATWGGSEDRRMALDVNDMNDVNWRVAAAATNSVRATLDPPLPEPRDRRGISDKRPLRNSGGNRARTMMTSKGTSGDAPVRRWRSSERYRAKNRGAMNVGMERGSAIGRDSGDIAGGASRALQLQGRTHDGDYRRGVVEAQDDTDEGTSVAARVRQVTKALGVSSDDYDNEDEDEDEDGHGYGYGHGCESMMRARGGATVMQKIEMAGWSDDRRLGYRGGSGGVGQSGSRAGEADGII